MLAMVDNENRMVCITRQLIQQTIAEMDLDPAALAEVEAAFIGLACCDFSCSCLDPWRHPACP